MQEVTMSNRLLLHQPTRVRPDVLFSSASLPSWAAVRAAWRRYRSRRRIADLDGYLLKDIGVSFAEAETEANKPFWRE
jgi:uncharacterized protein YjiS (DUF1127 family)